MPTRAQSEATIRGGGLLQTGQGGGGSAVWDANFENGLKAIGYLSLAPTDNVSTGLFIDRDGYQGAITVTANPAELSAVTAGNGTFEVLFGPGTTTTDIPAGVSAVAFVLDSGTITPGTYPLTITLEGGGITQTVEIQYTFL